MQLTSKQIITLACLVCIGCSSSTVSSVPNVSALKVEQLLKEIERMIASNNYVDARNTLDAVDAAKLAARAYADGDIRYLAVAEYTIVLPGLPTSDALAFGSPPHREIPGTSDVVHDMGWQTAATQFAEKFNLAMQRLVQANDAKSEPSNGSRSSATSANPVAKKSIFEADTADAADRTVTDGMDLKLALEVFARWGISVDEVVTASALEYPNSVAREFIVRPQFKSNDALKMVAYAKKDNGGVYHVRTLNWHINYDEDSVPKLMRSYRILPLESIDVRVFLPNDEAANYRQTEKNPF